MFPPIRLREAMSLGGLSVRELAVRTWRKSNENEIMTRAAAVSFYAMLALVPFLALVLFFTIRLLPDVTGLTGRTTGVGNMTTRDLVTTLQRVFPVEASRVIEGQIAELQKQTEPPLGLLLFSLATTVWLASSLFVAVIDAMNRIYGVRETRSMVKIRLVAIGMTFLQALILVGSLLAIVLGSWVFRWLGMSAGSAAVAAPVLWLAIAFAVLLSFALSFYVGPDADQRWEWITPGSLVGTAVFLASSLCLRVYAQHLTDYHKTYGSLAGVMLLLFWFWVSSLVLLSAAQMNKVIEEASPLGKPYGHKADRNDPPDLKALEPEAAQAE